MNSYIKIVALLFIIPAVFAQAPPIEWQNRIGGSNWNISYSSIVSVDGGYTIGGRSNSNISGDKTENSRGGFDYWIVNITNTGVITWDKTVGGASPTGNEQDFFGDIKQTPDGGYIMCGTSNSPLSGDKLEDALNQPYSDYWIVKTNSIGAIEWQNVIGGSTDDVVYSLELASDGGYIIGGYSDSSISYDKTESSRGLQDYWVLKLNSLGNIEWQKTLGGNGNDILNRIIQTSDGGYLLGGRSNSNISGDKTENSRGGSDWWIIKLNASGTEAWQKTIGGSGHDDLNQIIEANDGGYLFAGSSSSPISGDKTEPNKGSDDYWIMKADTNGNIVWQKTYGGNESDEIYSAALCAGTS